MYQNLRGFKIFVLSGNLLPKPRRFKTNNTYFYIVNFLFTFNICDCLPGKMGDPNASIPTPQPVIYRHMFGAYGKAVHKTCFTFVSQVSLDNRIVQSYDLHKQVLAVKNCRNISKKDLIHNDKTPQINVDPETYEVRVNGEYITCEPVSVVPLGQRYFLF